MKSNELEKLYNRDVTVKNAMSVAEEMQDIKDWEKEVFVVFCLDSANHIISREIISIGILNASIIHAREIFRTAIIRNANSIIISHNHPSGTIGPSDEDIRITKQIRKAGDIIGVKLLDHVIVTRSGGFHSMVENDEL